MTNPDLTLALRALQSKLLARFRIECLYQIDNKLKDYEISKFLGISATSFSLASSGVSTLSGTTLYRLICALIGLKVDVFNYFELEPSTLDFITLFKPCISGELFDECSSSPKVSDKMIIDS